MSDLRDQESGGPRGSEYDTPAVPRKKKTRRGKRANRLTNKYQRGSSDAPVAPPAVPYSQLTWEQRRDLQQQSLVAASAGGAPQPPGTGRAGRGRNGRNQPPRAPHVRSLPTNSPPLPPPSPSAALRDVDPFSDNEASCASCLTGDDMTVAPPSGGLWLDRPPAHESSTPDAGRSSDVESVADADFTREYQTTMYSHLDSLSHTDLLTHARQQEMELEHLRQQLSTARRRLGQF